MARSARKIKGGDERPTLRVHEPPPEPAWPARPFLTAREFAAYLGVSRRTFKRWKAAGLLPRPIRERGWGRWPRDEIMRWARCGRPDQQTWDRLNNCGASRPQQSFPR